MRARKTQITVKEVDETAFKELKAAAARGKIAVGAALTLAIEAWLAMLQQPKLQLTQWKSIQGGAGTEHISEKVDEMLYG